MSEKARLKLFIYLLLRDRMPFGAIEKVMEDLKKVEEQARAKHLDVKYSEPLQEEYAEVIATRLLR